MLFVLVLGVLLGGAAVVLLQQWRSEALVAGPARSGRSWRAQTWSGPRWAGPAPTEPRRARRGGRLHRAAVLLARRRGIVAGH